ncbi:serine/threonine-protein kinase [Nocardioides daeguensis]|uniref:non-specific serine/threonine protein kinase n=1 Tax=Nocardioides daeguensis TaxID=908359 RepID=A0ABP6V598_9ACTN|nr:serine/threonine-protein kinase [Nocardioides daeguensis]MBV6726374.1 serine/threonine protein kinase [Nocardioides daeguensis]MCR1772217.1 serine/threonine protein kinase [Nocardioides daeguensis]
MPLPPDPADPADPADHPDRLGPYRMVRCLGRGGMGTVYDALDTSLGRHVALKLIVPELADDPDFRARFVREAQAQASLDSPHVVQVFAHGEIDGRLYLATQLVPDGDLGAALRRHGRLPVAEAVDVVAQVADGLAEAHRAGLVHRDIKASNVLLRRRGTHTVAYLADFGIAVPARGDAAVDDVRALVQLLREVIADAPGAGPPRLARVLREPPTTAAALRDALRAGEPARPSRRWPRRWSRRWLAVACAAGVACALAPVAGMVDRRPPEQDPVAALARSLEQEAGLDPATARCTARSLAATHRTEELEDLPVDDVLGAAAACLWRPTRR